MSDVTDPYRVLGVRRAATLADIKSAHRRLAKAHHPDAGGDRARFLAVQAAYQILSDPDQRRRWDTAHGPGPVAPGDSYEPRRTAGPGRRADGARERRGGPRPRPEAAHREDGRRAGRPDPPGSGRDPSQTSWTWSAAGVPWWEEGARRRATGAGDTGAAPREEAEAAGDQAGRRARRRAPGGRRGQPDPRQAAAAQGATSPEPPSGEGAPADVSGGDHAGADGSAHGAAGRGQADPGVDVYSRSSGAAWSAASRAYFRKVAADIPRGARMGHSSWTGRTGWEPSAEEIAQVAVRRTGRRRARPSRRPVAPVWTRPAADPVSPPDSRSVGDGPSSIRRLADRLSRALGR